MLGMTMVISRRDGYTFLVYLENNLAQVVTAWKSPALIVGCLVSPRWI